MTRLILIRAILTAAFCAVFALIVDMVLDQLSAAQIMMIAAMSGFCGSLFAHLVLRPARHEGEPQ